MRTIFATIAAVVMASQAAAMAQTVDHPTYKSWAAHPVGTTVALRSVTESKGVKLTTTTTSKLVELTPDKAVIETRRVSDATGTLSEGLPQRVEHLRPFPLLPGMKKEQIGRPLNPIEEGEEEIEVAGRKIKTFWYDQKAQGDAGAILTRTWLSDEVPGRMVKSVSNIPKAATVVTVELFEFKTP